MADLHIHSTASDGEYSPAEIAGMLEKRHISVAALADHDSFSGFYAFREAFRGFAVPGVELSVNYEGIGFHLLAYGFDPGHRAFTERLEHFQQVRLERIEKMCRRLNGAGVSRYHAGCPEELSSRDRPRTPAYCACHDGGRIYQIFQCRLP
ncbi:MAG: hypothetical protein U5N26_08805 [Candidatus Marinimicrobia bacterium]|nr:hypothetical protein [Candidatus Neomarinimicrobiota bacterium]